MNVITAGSLTLEPQAAAHAQEMLVVLGDPAIYQYEGEPPPSLEWLRARYARLESRLSPKGHEQWRAQAREPALAGFFSGLDSRWLPPSSMPGFWLRATRC